MPADGVTVHNPLHRSFRRLVVATVVVYLALAGVAIYAVWQSNNTNTALCALRSDLENRVSESKSFISQHPNGIPGISAATLRVSTHNAEHTITALGIVSC
jgi:hypothetical protein